MKRLLLLLVAVTFAITGLPQTYAQTDDAETVPAEASETMTADEFNAQLDWKNGEIDLNDVAKLNLTPAYRFLDRQDAQAVLEQAWGNPPDADVLGMIFPAKMGPLDDDAWAVILYYQEDGHVDDDEAVDIDYNDLLSDMKKSTNESNEARAEMGFGTVELLGWAEQPHYDQTGHKLYWAKELNFSQSEEHTLNYDIRVLGRQGVLVMTAVAGMNQINNIKPSMEDLLLQADFKTGHRYEDFNPEVDKMAAYGIGALIAGKAAAKLGLFAGLFKFLLAAKKLVLVGVLAVAGGVFRLFGKKEAEEA